MILNMTLILYISFKRKELVNPPKIFFLKKKRLKDFTLFCIRKKKHVFKRLKDFTLFCIRKKIMISIIFEILLMPITGGLAHEKYG